MTAVEQVTVIPSRIGSATNRSR